MALKDHITDREFAKFAESDGETAVRVYVMNPGGGGGGDTMWTPTNLPGSPQVVSAATAISRSTAQRELLYVASDGGDVTMSANPQIAVGTTHGYELLIYGTSDTDTLTLINGNGLSLNGPCTLRDGSSLHLVWNTLVWAEVSRNDI